MPSLITMLCSSDMNFVSLHWHIFINGFSIRSQFFHFTDETQNVIFIVKFDETNWFNEKLIKNLIKMKIHFVFSVFRFRS